MSFKWYIKYKWHKFWSNDMKAFIKLWLKPTALIEIGIGFTLGFMILKIIFGTNFYLIMAFLSFLFTVVSSIYLDYKKNEWLKYKIEKLKEREQLWHGKKN